MKTIEAAYIMPVIFIMTSISIMFSFKLHDRAVFFALSYGILTDQASSLENANYNPNSCYTKKEVSDIIDNFFIVSEDFSLSACLSGNSLYIKNTTEKNSTPAFFSNFERCDTIRKESTLITNLLKNTSE